jgi:hypothetical protein
MLLNLIALWFIFIVIPSLTTVSLIILHSYIKEKVR